MTDSHSPSYEAALKKMIEGLVEDNREIIDADALAEIDKALFKEKQAEEEATTLATQPTQILPAAPLISDLDTVVLPAVAPLTVTAASGGPPLRRTLGPKANVVKGVQEMRQVVAELQHDPLELLPSEADDFKKMLAKKQRKTNHGDCT